MKIKKLAALLIFSFIISILPTAVNAAVEDIYSPFNATEYDETSAPNNFVKRTGYVAMNGRSHAQWICFKDIDFADAPYAVAISTATAQNYLANNTYELRIDSPTGKLISTVYVTDCADWGNPVENVGVVTDNVTGVHDLYVSTNQPNDMYSLYFMAKIANDNAYKPYDGTNIFPDMKDRKDEYKVNILNGLGIMEAYEDNLFYPEIPETRAAFAKQLAYILTDEVPEYSESAFDDVTTDIDGYNEINYLFEKSVINGNEHKMFNPWSFITYREAAIMTLRALGYAQVCDYNGGYPKGYEKQATSTGLVKGKSFDDYVRRSTAAEMFYKAINMNYFTFDGISGNGLKYKEEKYILSDTRSIESAKGVVMATAYSGVIADNKTSEGYCYIDSELYNTNGVKVENYIGVLCEFYYKTESDGTRVLVCIAPDRNVKEVLLNTKDDEISQLDRSSITYNKDGKNKTLKISSDAIWIYNNKALARDITEVVDVDTFRGRIRLVDNGDGYKTVFVDQYINVKVRAFDTTNDILIDELTGKKYEFTGKRLFISDGNETVRPGRLKKDQLAELYMSDDGELNIMLLGESEITGVASNIDEGKKVTIDGSEYYIAKEIKDEIFFGVQYIFHLSRNGEVVWIEKKDTSKQVGAYNRYKEIDGKTYVSIITATNTISDFEIAPKIFVDGVAMKDYYDFEEGVKKHPGLKQVEKYSPVLYRLNDAGQIFMLDTVLDVAENDNDTLVELHPYDASGNYYYRAATGCFTGRSTFSLTRPVKADSTMIFVNDDECIMKNLKEYYTDLGHPFGFYSSKRKSGIADIIYTKNYYKNASQQFAIFYSANEGINGIDDELGLHVTVYDDTGKHKYFVSAENEDCTKYIKSLVRGDVVKFRTDLNGEISDVEVGAFLNGNETNSAGLAAAVSLSKGSNGTNDLADNFVYGIVEGVEDDYIQILPYGGKDVFWCKLSGNTLIRVKEKELEPGLSVNMLRKGDKVLVRYEYGYKFTTIYE